MQFALLIGAMLFLGWCAHEPIPQPSPVVMTESTLNLLKVPDMSADEWEKACKREGSIAGEHYVGNCTITVAVFCPPDCGTYKLMRESRLVQRIR